MKIKKELCIVLFILYFIVSQAINRKEITILYVQFFFLIIN